MTKLKRPELVAQAARINFEQLARLAESFEPPAIDAA